MEDVTTKNLKVAGNIISELSEKIPSSIIALNELIKNSYDAFASQVTISLENNSKLVIEDNGIGMDENDIEKLFHISESKKKYGETISNEKLGITRITQGSKGLGFLSVFKFGNFVKWTTAKNGIESTFSIEREKLLKTEDLSKFKVKIIKKEVNYSGTKIEIDVNKEEYESKRLIESLEEEITSLKITNSFYDESFIVKIKGRNESETENKLKILDLTTQNLLFKVNFSSKENTIKYIDKNNSIIKEIPYHFNASEYTLDIKLNIYDFSGTAKTTKQKISKLFYKDEKDITPIIFINNNLFNNYDLFNPEVNRNVKGSLSLPQMTGYIIITSHSNQLEFNSDRTQLVDNKFTSEIKDYLKEINKFIQEQGSIIKRDIKKLKKEKTETTSTQNSLDSKITESKTTKASQESQQNNLFTTLKNSTETNQTTKIIGKKQDHIKLISLPCPEPYVTDIPVINNLINQINTLITKRDDFTEVIACSLRAIFEICIYQLQSASYFQKKLDLSNNTELSEKVKKVIELLANDKHTLTILDKNIGFQNFNNFKNKLKPDIFKEAVSLSHIGAHKSTLFLSQMEMDEIIDKVSYFSAITNELLKLK